MAKQLLDIFVREHLKCGYSIQNIKRHLLKYGHLQHDVQDAVRHVTKPTLGTRFGRIFEGVFHFSYLYMSISVIMIIISILFLTLVFMGFSKQSSYLPILVHIEQAKPVLYAGDNLEFSLQLSSSQKKKINLDIIYEVMDENSVVLLKAKEKIKGFRSSRVSYVSLTLPELKKGVYFVEAKLISKEKSRKKVHFFEVLERFSMSECPLTCDDNYECTTDYCSSETDFSCVHDDIFPCCGNDVCEATENSSICAWDCKETMTLDEPINVYNETYLDGKWTDKLSELIEISIRESVEFCKGLKRKVDKDHCFSILAQEAKEWNYCYHISDFYVRDNCLVNIAIDTNNFEICDELMNHNLRAACTHLGY